MRKLTTWVALGFLLALLAVAGPARAEPVLQLWIEPDLQGPLVYNPSGVDDETWKKYGTTSLNIWVVGDGTALKDVTLVISFPSTATAGTYTMTGLDGERPFGTFGDGTNPDPTFIDSTVYTVPPTPGGLPPHGMLPDGTQYMLVHLGDFGDDGTNITDFSVGNLSAANGTCGASLPCAGLDAWFSPVPSIPQWTINQNNTGQINVYTITFLTGFGVGVPVHFDVYGCAESPGKSGKTDCPFQDIYGTFTNAPFSHDASWEQVVPEPATLALFGTGLAALPWFVRRRRSTK